MKIVIFILVVGVLSATLFSCSPSELEVVIPINATVDEDISVNREGDVVGEEETSGEEEDLTGNCEGDAVGEDGTSGEEEDGTGK